MKALIEAFVTATKLATPWLKVIAPDSQSRMLNNPLCTMGSKRL
ncbi:Uncharacterised protein [Mycobacterium tuberculosis]|nr:Uncharacterised protein [Mycobacterium tuberculosis]